ncbi:MAG: PAS domain-containing protein [Gallionella sp.]|nr:PAS domain-containing protein [Gallionella sp.]
MNAQNNQQPADDRSILAENHFPLLRRFSVASLVAMLATAAILILLYRHDQLAEHESISEQQSEQIAIHFMRMLGDQVNTILPASNGLATGTLPANSSPALLSAVQEIVREHDVLKLKIYNLSRTIVYSSAKDEIGVTGLHTDFLAKALSGEASYRHEFRDSFHAATGELRDAYIDISYIPLNYAGKRIGAIAIYRDSTPVFRHLNTNTIRIPLIIFGVFALLYAALFFYIRRTDLAIEEWQKFIHDTALVGEAQQRMSRFIANVPGFVFSFRRSPEGHCSFPFASPGINEIYGLHPEDVRDDMAALHKLAHPEDARRVEDILDESARIMAPVKMEFRVLRPGHPECWIECRSTPECEADGGMIWHGIMLDITERKRVEAMLVQREHEFRTLAENMPDTLIRYDREGHRTYINPALKRISAVRDEQMIGLTQQESNPFTMPEIYRLALEHTLATGEHSELELPIRTPSGDIRTNLVSIAAERAADGQITGAITIGHDITERKQAERQLRELTAYLQTVREEEKAGFAREIHDGLGGTLFALNLQASLLNMELPADLKQTPLFDHIQLISQLIDSATVSMRSIINDMHPSILNDLGLPAAIKWQAEQFHKRSGIECRVSCCYKEGNEWCNYEYRECKLDKTPSINLFRIFQEALTNVERHSGASRVEVEFRLDDSEVMLSISDNGRGLPEGHNIAATSYGIRGMRERVVHLGGKIGFGRPRGGGFSISVELPLPAIT